MWDRLARVIVRRPVRVIVVAALVTVVLGVGLKSLEFRTSQDNARVVELAGLQGQTAVYQAQFGGESMLVLFTGDRCSCSPRRTSQSSNNSRST